MNLGRAHVVSIASVLSTAAFLLVGLFTNAGYLSAEELRREGSGTAEDFSQIGMQGWWLDAGAGVSLLGLAASFDRGGAGDGYWDASGLGVSYAYGISYAWPIGFSVGIGGRSNFVGQLDWRAEAGKERDNGADLALFNSSAGWMFHLNRDRHRFGFRFGPANVQIFSDANPDSGLEVDIANGGELDYTYHWYRSEEWEVGGTCSVSADFGGKWDYPLYDAHLIAVRLMLNVSKDVFGEPPDRRRR